MRAVPSDCLMNIALEAVIPLAGAMKVQFILVQMPVVTVAPVSQAVVEVFVPSLE